jgi:AcrR family transcriptional regulator
VTRAEILDAARRTFGERGYDGTTIRAIAAAAGVNQALVHHFFGTKEQIFIASVDFPVDPAVVLPVLLDGPREQFGERLARFLLSVWGDPVARAPLLALLRSSTGNEQAAAMLRDLLGQVLFGRVATATGASTLRISAAAGQAVGLMLLRYVVRVEPLASAPDEEIVAILAPEIQACIPDEAGPPPARPVPAHSVDRPA